MNFETLPVVKKLASSPTLIQFIKYLFVGGIAVLVNLTSLFVLTEFAKLYYLASAVCAFFISFGVSFALQKYWTFGNRTRDRIHRQVTLYLILQLANLALNTLLLYVLVDYLHVWYILAQAVLSLLIGFGIFVVNRKVIFVNKAPEGADTEELL